MPAIAHMADFLRVSEVPGPHGVLGPLPVSLSTGHRACSLHTTSSVTPSRRYPPEIPRDCCFLACRMKDKDIQ